MTTDERPAPDTHKPSDRASSDKAITRLKKRPEFLRVAGVRRRWAAPGLVLQAALMEPPKGGQPKSGPDAGPESGQESGQDQRPPYRYGVTATKKVGGSVVRNRAKRRLRALAESLLPELARPGYDFVLIARTETATRSYDLLISDLKTCLSRLKVTRPKQPEGGPEGGNGAVDGGAGQ